MSVAYERVVAHLDRLKLKRVAELLDPVCEQASKNSLSYIDFLGELLEAEASSRAERRLVAKTRLAHFPFHKTLADFDFSFQPSLDRKQIQELATLRFLAHGENVIFLGPPGVGKTHCENHSAGSGRHDPKVTLAPDGAGHDPKESLAPGRDALALDMSACALPAPAWLTARWPDQKPVRPGRRGVTHHSLAARWSSPGPRRSLAISAHGGRA